MDDAKTPAEEWFVFINYLSIFRELPASLLKRFNRVADRLKIQSLSPEVMEQYIERIMTQEDLEKYTVPAYEDGLAAGMKMGREEGREEGKEKGRSEAAHEVAAKLKAEGIAIETISRCTGVTVEDIMKL